jgi:MOSC domain-containing protein
VNGVIDSRSVGDPRSFLSLAELTARLAALPAAPRDVGGVALLVTRGTDGRRALLERAELTVDGGMPGDAWTRKEPVRAEAQLAVMQRPVAELIANGQALGLFGDNLFLDLDLAAASLPIGSRVRVGRALLEVTPKAHNGCRKFTSRFGDDALRFVADPARRPLNLRGIYLRVIENGTVAVGDRVEVVTRATGLA